MSKTQPSPKDEEKLEIETSHEPDNYNGYKREVLLEDLERETYIRSFETEDCIFFQLLNNQDSWCIIINPENGLQFNYQNIESPWAGEGYGVSFSVTNLDINAEEVSIVEEIIKNFILKIQEINPKMSFSKINSNESKKVCETKIGQINLVVGAFEKDNIMYSRMAISNRVLTLVGNFQQIKFNGNSLYESPAEALRLIFEFYQYAKQDADNRS
ncbi:hypothetical protein GW755_00745 [bacterium]|nr:hypothetical protein [bacterium]